MYIIRKKDLTVFSKTVREGMIKITIKIMNPITIFK